MTPSAATARVLPTSPDLSSYEGFISLPPAGPRGGGDAWVRLEGVEVPKRAGAFAAAPAAVSTSSFLLRRARLVLDPALEEVMKPHAAALTARLRDSPSVPAFLVELQALAGRAVAEAAAAAAPEAPPVPTTSSAAAAAAARALEAAGPAAWAALAGASPCGTRLAFQHTDAVGRVHALHVRVSISGGVSGGGGAQLSFTADLPAAALPPAWATTAPPPSLAAALDAWHAAVATCADLWAALDDLDARFRVLDPAPPTRADVHRVLALGGSGGGGGGGAGGGSLEIALSLPSPRSPPQVAAFMGAPAAVDPPRAALRAFIDAGRWDAAALPGANLAAAGVSILPVATAAARAAAAERTGAGAGAGAAAAGAGAVAEEEEPTGAECAICYAYHLPAEEEEEEGEGGGGAAALPAGPAVPSIHCPHPRCGRPYHAACLRGWLASLPGARVALGRLTGECAYCGEEVGVEAAGG